MEEQIIKAVIDFVSSYPKASAVLLLIGSLRVFLKPLVSVAQAYVDYTVDPKDNEKLKLVLESKAYKVLSFAVDYISSVKLPQKK